ncbi:MAG TPA: response regulator transcription factor [Chloroflexota bacterium]|jgi:DNA-binding response OmpR family regulator
MLRELRSPVVLVVDDSPLTTQQLVHYLGRRGFRVVTAADGITALEQARLEHPDIILLDLELPGLHGFEVCRHLRTFSNAYVLILTASTEDADLITGLTLGADDYVRKPFRLPEVEARLRALLRRPRTAPASEAAAGTAQRVGDLVIDPATLEVTLAGEAVSVTAREFTLLSTLASQPGRVYTRDQLLDQVFGSDHYDPHVIEVHVANLRRKLEADPSRPQYIRTVRGVGYRLSEPPRTCVPSADPSL